MWDSPDSAQQGPQDEESGFRKSHSSRQGMPTRTFSRAVLKKPPNGSGDKCLPGPQSRKPCSGNFPAILTFPSQRGQTNTQAGGGRGGGMQEEAPTPSCLRASDHTSTREEMGKRCHFQPSSEYRTGNSKHQTDTVR